MLLFLSLAGLILSVILVVFNVRRFRSSCYLGGFFFLISLYAFNQYVLVDSHSRILVTVFFVHPGFLYYLIGPMLYFYVRSVLTDHTRFRTRDLWHLVPASVILISTIPYMILPLSVKESYAEVLVANILNVTSINTSLFYSVMHFGLTFIFRPLLVLGYAIWSLGLFIRWLGTRRNILVLSYQNYIIPWLTVLLGFVFILTISHLITMIKAYYFNDLKVYLTLGLLQLFSGFGLIGLLISLLFFPYILYGLPRIPDISPEASHLVPDFIPGRVSLDAHLSRVPAESPKPGFEAVYMKMIGTKVDECMQQLRPYLRHDCNLSYMAKLTGIPAHHMAYYFREIKHQAFNDYRNCWRVGHAQELIREGKARQMTLEAIGLLSGFSTRNTFYMAFKKVLGVSPKVYWEKNRV
jgi:AraC-like DNA-binding protein